MGTPSSFSSIITEIESMIQFDLFVGGLAAGVLAFSFFPLPRVLEKRVAVGCISGLSEYNTMMMFAAISLSCVIISVLVIGIIKPDLLHLFREEVDAKMSARTAVTSVIRWCLFFAQVIGVAGFASVSLSSFYAIQLKSKKFSCMAMTTQAGLLAFLIVLVICVIIKVYRMYRRTFVEIHVPKTKDMAHECPDLQR